MEKKKGKHSQREARGNRNMWRKVEGERNNQVRKKKWGKRGSRNRLWWRCIQKKPPRSLTRAGYKQEEEDRRDIKKTSSLNTWFAWELISYTSTTETRRSTFLVLLFKQQLVPLGWQLRLDAKRKRQYLMTRKEHFVALTLVWVNHGLSASFDFWFTTRHQSVNLLSLSRSEVGWQPTWPTFKFSYWGQLFSHTAAILAHNGRSVSFGNWIS